MGGFPGTAKTLSSMDLRWWQPVEGRAEEEGKSTADGVAQGLMQQCLKPDCLLDHLSMCPVSKLLLSLLQFEIILIIGWESGIRWLIFKWCSGVSKFQTLEGWTCARMGVVLGEPRCTYSIAVIWGGDKYCSGRRGKSHVHHPYLHSTALPHLSHP